MSKERHLGEELLLEMLGRRPSCARERPEKCPSRAQGKRKEELWSEETRQTETRTAQGDARKMKNGPQEDMRQNPELGSGDIRNDATLGGALGRSQILRSVKTK